MLQAEFSLTQVFDRPDSGRRFFEDVIREHLDLGRPSQVQLLFDRRITKRTPGSFRTRIVTRGVVPSLSVDYKSSHVKQYFKEGRALRTETVVNDPRDFGLGKRLANLSPLRELAFDANRRLLHVERSTRDNAVGETVFRNVTTPCKVGTQRASALPYGDPLVLALFQFLLMFRHLAEGFRSRDLRAEVPRLLGHPPGSCTPGQATYHLRRLRLHGLIERIPFSHAYRVTDDGLKTVLFFNRTYARLIRPGLTDLFKEPQAPLSIALSKFDQALLDLATTNSKT